MHHRVSK